MFKWFKQLIFEVEVEIQFLTSVLYKLVQVPYKYRTLLREVYDKFKNTTFQTNALSMNTHN